MKTCSWCKSAKAEADFSVVSGKPGSWCKACCCLKSSAYARLNKGKRREYAGRPEVRARKALSDARYREKNADTLLPQKRAYYQKNKMAMSEQRRINYTQEPEAAKARTKQWKIANRSKHNAKCMERHTRKLMACPAWMDEDQKWMIEEIYDLAIRRTAVTGVKHHVDHIVPLQHKLVCGLHVPWNLQVITASENCSKRNSFTLS